MNLETKTLHKYRQIRWDLRKYLEQVVLVLVTNDTALTVSSSKQLSQSTPFYFFNSQYRQHKRLVTYSELEDTHFLWHLYSTMAVYVKGKLKHVQEFESATLLLPKVLLEKEIPKFQQMFVKCFVKALHHSVFWCDSALYRENTLEIMKTLM